MPEEFISPAAYLKGEVRGHNVHLGDLSGFRLCHVRDIHTQKFAVLPGGWQPRTEFKHNQFLYEWAAIFGNLLLRKGTNYGIGGMYIEFENVASPGDPVTVPSFTREPSEGVEYYNDLITSPDRDYLRVPLVAGSLQSTDTTVFPLGNRPVFFAQTSGTEGVHGKEFSAAANSVAFGGALVAFVDNTDPTQDLVLSRFYFDVENQMPKLDTSEIGLEWRIRLG